MLSEVLIEHLPEILTGVASIAALWFTYNQYTKNKITDYKVEKWKNEEREADKVKAGITANIFGELWSLLYGLDAIRVFIVQPHPLYKQVYLTATMEVKQYGIASALDDFKQVKLDSMPGFAARLAKEDLIQIEETKAADIEPIVKANMLQDGCNALLIKRLADERNNWIGNIIVGFRRKLSEVGLDTVKAQNMLESSARAIQYDLPEYIAED